ncbi:hypothetical protein F2Q69_00038603 [Brassica cretica]|uniref:Uncharacterized protein n=1 Tax=Brassica cretica TaxID=69181 RepID=A0A8S9SA57_BRACR|nr:hypothetical protein F2Q69_00038603 [Brassica cretica]
MLDPYLGDLMSDCNLMVDLLFLLIRDQGIRTGCLLTDGLDNPDHQENLEQTRDGTSWNGRVLRRDASDRDQVVWRLIADVRRGRRSRLLLEFASGFDW